MLELPAAAFAPLQGDVLRRAGHARGVGGRHRARRGAGRVRRATSRARCRARAARPSFAPHGRAASARCSQHLAGTRRRTRPGRGRRLRTRAWCASTTSCARAARRARPDARRRRPRRDRGRRAARRRSALRRGARAVRGAATARTPATSRCARSRAAASGSAAASRRSSLPALRGGAFLEALPRQGSLPRLAHRAPGRRLLSPDTALHGALREARALAAKRRRLGAEGGLRLMA